MSCLEKYKTEEQFVRHYGLDKVDEYVTKYRDRMFTGDAPTLFVVCNAFGNAAVIDWLNTYITDLVLFYGVQDKTDAYQIDGTARTIYQNYNTLKVTEVMLCFSLMKGSYFRNKDGDDVCKMYGRFQGDSILDCFHRFKEYRRNEISKIENAESKKKEKENLATKEFIRSIVKKITGE